jgi:hypothetical protein
MKNKIIILFIIIFLSACAQTTKQEAPTPTQQALEKIQGRPALPFGGNHYDNYQLSVSLGGGKVNFNNIDGFAEFIPVEFTLKNNETKSIVLKKSGNNFFDSATVLTVTYEQGILSLDTLPNPYTQHPEETSKTTLSFSPEWLTGKTYYNISTHGKAGLSNTAIQLHLLSS